jgi:hypothetical protein
MKTSILWRVASLVTIALALSRPGLGEPAGKEKLGGAINDYTAALDTGGPRHVSGRWSVSREGESGQADFSAALGMVRADNPARAAHTHHVTVSDGEVTALANGSRISGTATITSNGSLAGFSGSPVTVDVTGGNTLTFSNVSVTFGAGAAAHFGDQPLHGVVTGKR